MYTYGIAAVSRLDNFLQLLGALVIFIFVLALTYFVTRWLGNYQKTQMSDRNMQIIEIMRVSNNKYIQIVKVVEEYLVLGISKDHIELLTKLSQESIQQLKLPQEKTMESFQEILKKFTKNKK